MNQGRVKRKRKRRENPQAGETGGVRKNSFSPGLQTLPVTLHSHPERGPGLASFLVPWPVVRQTPFVSSSL